MRRILASASKPGEPGIEEIDIAAFRAPAADYPRRTHVSTAIGIIASLALLTAMGALGVGLLRRFARHLTNLEGVAYGAPIGMVIGTLAMVPLGIVLGFGGPVVVLVGVACAAAAAWLLVSGPRPSLARPTSVRDLVRRVSWAPTLVIGAFAARWAIYWLNAVTYRVDGLWAGHVNIWGDWPVHFGVVSSFVYGANFPPQHPRFDDYPFAYHYLADLTAAAQVTLGMDVAGALALHSWIGCVLVAIGLYAFARRLTRRRGAATLAVVLFLLGGGLGWWAMASGATASDDPLGTLRNLTWDYHIKTQQNFQVVNMFYGFLASQRAFLYGLPIAFATFSTLLAAVRRRDRRLFALAGLIAGLLPLAHLATLLAMVVVIPLLFLLFPSRAWLWFGVAAAAVAGPQLLTQLGGGAGALAATHFALGWMAGEGPDSWPWFWLKNLGLFAPLVIAALVWKRLVPGRARRLLLAFMGVFVVANVVAFQPWTWDNHKILVYWFLGVAILVAALLARIWRRTSGTGRAGLVGRRVLVAGVVVSMTLSGLLEDIGTILGQSSYRMLDPQRLAIAEQVRAATPPDALFVVGMENHDPIAMLTGRRIFVGYLNWLWTEGVPYTERAAIVKEMYGDLGNADALFAQYEIDFIVVGPHERKDFGADDAGLEARHPIVAETNDWAVYDVRGARTGG